MKNLVLVCSFVLLQLVVISLCDREVHRPDYQFDLSPAGGAIEGYVTSKSQKGSKVPTTQVEGQVFVENEKEVNYLQVIIKTGVRNGTERFVLENTDAFKVDSKGFIVVNNTDTFDHPQAIEFYVVMFRSDEVVSDPVPFIVRVQDHVTKTTIAPYHTACINQPLNMAPVVTINRYKTVLGFVILAVLRWETTCM